MNMDSYFRFVKTNFLLTRTGGSLLLLLMHIIRLPFFILLVCRENKNRLIEMRARYS